MVRSVKKKPKVKEGTVKRKTVKSASNKEIFLEEVPSSSYIVIDYPNEAEVINGSRYALRMGASNDGYVEFHSMTANGFLADLEADTGGLTGRALIKDVILYQQDL